jgi:hypothetical protein
MPSVTDLSGTVTVDIINGAIPSVRTDIDGIFVDKKNLKMGLESKYCLDNVAAIIFLVVSCKNG